MDYGDIIDLPHHISPRHAHLSMESRAAQFSPFAALTGYGDAIDETARLTAARIELDDDRKAELDEKLRLCRTRCRRPSASRTLYRTRARRAAPIAPTRSR